MDPIEEFLRWSKWQQQVQYEKMLAWKPFLDAIMASPREETDCREGVSRGHDLLDANKPRRSAGR